MSKYPHQTVVIHQPASTSGLAIAGLIFSILGWFTCGLLCIPGAFFCLLALFSRGPKGTAIAGLIVGFPGTLFFAFVGLGMIMGFLGLGAASTSAVRDADRSQSQSHDTVQIPAIPPNTDKPTAESRGDADQLAGDWNCVSELTQEGEMSPRYHRSWEFTGDRVNINGERTLWYGLDENALPKRLDVYNLVAGRKIPLYACIYKFEGAKLIVCFQAGEEAPDNFTTQRIDTVLLTFVRPGTQAPQSSASPPISSPEEPSSAATAVEAAKWRTWTTADRKYTVEAKFIKFTAGTLTIEKKDGTTVDLKLDILCSEDQEFVKQRKWTKPLSEP